MKCACSREASYGSLDCIDGYDAGTPPVTVVDNGELCFECQTFYCRHCIAAAMLADPAYDPSLCLPCDARYPRDVAV